MAEAEAKAAQEAAAVRLAEREHERAAARERGAGRRGRPPRGRPARGARHEAVDAGALLGRVQAVRGPGARLRAGRARHRVGGRGLRLRRAQLHGVPGRHHRHHPDRLGHPAHLLAHPDPDRPDRGRHRRHERRSLHPGPGRLRARRSSRAGTACPTRRRWAAPARSSTSATWCGSASGSPTTAATTRCRCRPSRAPGWASRSRSSRTWCATRSPSTWPRWVPRTWR